MTQTVHLSSLTCLELARETGIDGTVYPAGTRLVLVPLTHARNVRTADGRSLVDVLDEEHLLLAGQQTNLTRYADRLTRLEIWAAGQGYKEEA